MGFFDKFSKKEKNSVDELADKADKLISADNEKKSEEKDKKEPYDVDFKDVADNVEEKKKSEPTEKKTVKKPSEDERFTVLVEDAFQLKDGQGVVVGGTLHGKLHNHEVVYILHPILGSGIEVEVDGIEEGPMNMVEEASNSRVGIKFTSIKDRNQIPRYSVVTNIRPVEKPTKDEPNVESPFLLGLCREYDRLIKDGAYQSIFTFAVFSARYITPVKVDVDMINTTEAKAVLKKDSKISFKLLHKPDDNDVLALPVFTDYYELKLWKEAYEGSEQPQNFFMTFDQCAEIGLKNGGFVINPFGSRPVFVSNDNIQHVLQMKANLDKKIAEEKAENK